MNEDIVLRYLLDKASLSATEQGTKALTQTIEKLDDSLSDENLTRELEKVVRQLKAAEEQTKDTIAGLKAEARVLSATASAIVDGAQKAQLSFIKTLGSQLDGISRLSIATGAALVGGILGFANKYVNEAKESTAVTIAWKRAQDDLNKSGQRFGAVLAQEALPLLEKAAALANTASRFIEKNPDIVQGALRTGVVLAALGAVGTAVSRGIKIYADIQYLATIPVQLTAAKLQDAAASKQLEAALLRAKEIGVSVPGSGGSAAAATTGGLAAAVSSVGLVVAGVIASKYAVDLVNIVLQKTGIAKSIADAQQKILETSKRPYPGIITAARPTGGGATASAIDAVSSTTFSPAFDAVLKAYEQYRSEDLAATEKYLQDKKSIEQNALEASRKANADYAANVARVNSQTTQALSAAAKDLQAANEKAEIDYQTNRAQIIRDGNQEIEQLQTDLQERLRKNEKEHEERKADLTASRDALGLKKENDRFKDEQSEAKREAKQEIAQRRADIAQRLADLQQSYEQERAQRFADYEARTAEIRAQAAQQLAELQAQHAAELREIQQQKIARIRELDEQYAEERKRRYQQLIQTIRDLDASLLGEKNLRLQYYDAMTKDLDAFLAKYKAGLGGVLGSVPGRAEGGYTSGLVHTGERGVEYVMSHNTTRAAEAMIGGRLTQQGIIAALSGMGGGRQSVTWNDQRRFSGEYTNAIRNANRRDTLDLLQGVFQ